MVRPARFGEILVLNEKNEIWFIIFPSFIHNKTIRNGVSGPNKCV